MRITAGVHRSRVLKTLDGVNTRPTADRVKEAIFSSVGPYFQDEEILDLFGGSGGIALEAISRGMKFAYIVDANKDAIKVISENVTMLKEEARCKIIQSDYQTALNQLKDKRFAFIYLDPPYKLEVIDNILNFIDDYHLLEENGVIVVETDKQQGLKKEYENFSCYKEKQYGMAKITYFK